ncbi:MAG: beta-glucuronidase [Bacteroidaceae bacterium]|nr:beta-glucuronidase [Bacteroidaceae bacterium]
MRHVISAILLTFLCIIGIKGQSISISGQWEFQTDPENAGITQKWYGRKLSDNILLPGSMPERLKGNKVGITTKWTGTLYDSSFYFNPYMDRYRKMETVKFPFFLTPVRHYTGVAWYSRTITIPKSMAGKRLTLFLERPHIESTVWIDGRKAGSNKSLCAPHVYDITALAGKGTHRLTIRIDNSPSATCVGADSHSITDQTQGNWNGIVGRMEIRAEEKAAIRHISVYPDVDARKADVRLLVANNGKQALSTTITLSAQSFNSDRQHRVAPATKRVTLAPGVQEVCMTLPMEGAQLWDEFSPALYRLQAAIASGKTQASATTTFGMRKFEIKGKMFYINGRKTMLRGTVENCCFPETGYAPTTVDEWERVFRICRQYGLNHMRFHSYCPPEAAFEAADLVGFYIQPEGPSWPNHGVKLGRGMEIDTFLLDETKRINEAYGNHASFCMLACGNEPAGNWVAWCSRFVDYWRKTDPRHVYTGASVGNSWAWQPRSEYHVKAGARGLNEWKKSAPETTYDYRDKIDTVRQPYVSHETGQWCAFPDLEETNLYTGVNKALNFDIFRDLLRDGGMESLAHKFLMASGKLQLLCYKHEIERTLRTPDYAGFQLLGLNDYSGQGSAIVGLLGVHFNEKGYATADDVREFCSPIVPLARIAKFTYKNSETLHADIEVANFGSAPLKDARTLYTITDQYGKVYSKGCVSQKDIEIGNCIGLGSVDFALATIDKAVKLTLNIKIEGTEARNHWDFWVYPSKVKAEAGEVLIADSLTDEVINTLKHGGKVLLTAGGKITFGKEIVQQFTPVFWNTSWFKMRPPHTTGIYVNNTHPAFRQFPTDYHSDLQWWELQNKVQVMQFSEFPKDFQPLVQSIDTWFLSRKAGTLFEANVLGGKLMMTTMDIKSDLGRRIVARQLRKSLLDYMNSDSFRPQFSIDIETIGNLFTKEAPKVNMFTNDSPDELKKNIK